MPSQQHIDALRNFVSTNKDSWILLRDDLGKKPTLMFKYKPDSWNTSDDQIGLGNPEDGNPPYFFWALNKNAQWEIVTDSSKSIHIKGPVKWLVQAFETEQEIDDKISQLKAL